MSGFGAGWRAFAVGVGANVGDRAVQVATAMRLLAADDQVRHLEVAPAIVTEPVIPGGDPEAHPEYLNTAIIGETTRSPEILMSRLLTVEAACGRRRRGTVDPRTLDLDLLVYEGASLIRDGLQVPHPRLSGRRFVLEPLVDLIHRLEQAGVASGTSRSTNHRLAMAIRRSLQAAGVGESELR